MNNRMLALYGLKWNPFTPNVPTEALHVTPRLESFCWRVQQLAGDGGFALVTGAPGGGKSATLRILAASLATQRDVTVGVISRPQANIADFYRLCRDRHKRYNPGRLIIPSRAGDKFSTVHYQDVVAAHPLMARHYSAVLPARGFPPDPKEIGHG